MTVQLRNGLFQHSAVTRVTGGLQLLGEASAGKKQTFAFPVALLVVG
ncbi:MAG: hypothetical protein ABSD76_15225 [Terriglobales bacterium]